MFGWDDLHLEHFLEGERNARAALTTYARSDSLMRLRSKSHSHISTLLNNDNSTNSTECSPLESLAPELFFKVVQACEITGLENVQNLRLASKRLCLAVNRSLRECSVKSTVLNDLLHQYPQPQRAGWTSLLTAHFPGGCRLHSHPTQIKQYLQLNGVKQLRFQSVGSDSKLGSAARLFFLYRGYQLPNLEEIDMFGFSAFQQGMTGEIAEALVGQCPRLKILAAPVKSEAVTYIASLRCLHTLTVDKGTGVCRFTDADMRLMSRMTQLRSLSMNCGCITALGFAHLTSLRGLTYLEAHDLRAPLLDEDLAGISNLQGLSELVIGGSNPAAAHHGPRAIAAYASLPKLRTLTVAGPIDAPLDTEKDAAANIPSASGGFRALRKLVLQYAEIAPAHLELFYPDPVPRGGPLKDLDLMCATPHPWQDTLNKVGTMASLKVVRLPALPGVSQNVESYMDTLPAVLRHQLKVMQAKQLLQYARPVVNLKTLPDLQQVVVHELDHRLFDKLKGCIPLVAFGVT